MLLIIIGFVVLIIGYINFRSGFLWFMVLKIFLNQNISLLDIPGIPLLSMDMFMTLYFVVLFLFRKKDFSKCRFEFPYIIPFVCLFISWCLSAIFAFDGFKSTFSRLIGDICQSILMIYIMWEVIDSENDFRFLFKWFTIAFLGISVYAFYEWVSQTNPLQTHYVELMNGSERTLDFSYRNDPRGYRVQSVFLHPIGGGINFAMYIVYAFVALYSLKISSTVRKMAWIVLSLCFPCILFTNSRAPIVFIMIAIMMFFDSHRRNYYVLLMSAVTIIIIIWPFLGQYALNISSIFDQSLDVKGSNMDMRFEQMKAVIQLTAQHPWLGWGQKVHDNLHNHLTAKILGYESMWFEILASLGILGMLANVISAYFSLWKLPHLFKSKPMLFLALAYWVTASLTSVPGMLMHMYYLLLIFFIKHSSIYQKVKLHLIMYEKSE